MAVADTHSTTLTNLEADPLVVADIRNQHGRLRIKTETVAIAAADDDTSTYRFFRVKSSDSIKSLQLVTSADVTSGTDFDLGLYTIDSGSAVDADLYADGISLATQVPAVPHVVATASYLECRFGDASTAVVGDINNQVWEDLGLTSDPGLQYDVVLTGNTVGSAAANVTLTMLYTAGD